MPFIGVQPASALLTSADIQDGQITTAKVADDAITTAKINVNGGELALDADGDTSITADTDDQMDIKIGGSDAMHIKATASHGTGLGIGTSAPLRQLHISNTSANSEISFTAGTSGTSSLLFGDGLTGTDVYRGYLQYQHSDDDMLFATSSTERMRITSEGRVNCNTGVSDDTGFRFLAPSGQTSKVAEFAMQSGVGCHLPVNSTSFTASSDETLKKNITEFNKQESYDNIKNLRAVTFSYKDWTLNGIDYQDDKKRIGFIAQDWQTNYPEVIDKDQNDKLSMKYTETIPVLLSALQKAQEKIEALEARLTALESK